MFIINTNSGVLHTKECADGETGLPAVDAGSRQHFSTAEAARKHESYKKDHQECMG